jgi:AcrR family transcriptional regulator/DNA-binding XRE family transcriptional regulator
VGSKAGNKPDPRVGEHLRSRRKQSGLSLSALASLVGVSPATLSQIENGRTRVTDERIRALSQHIDLDLALLDVPVETAVRENTDPADWRTYEPLSLDPVAEAALKLFVDKGYHGTSIRDIARSLESSISGIYNRHGSKQEVLAYLMDLTMTELVDRIEKARADGADPVERFSLMVESLALYHVHRQDLAFVGATEMRSLEPAHRDRIAELRRQIQHSMDVEVQAAHEAGHFKTVNPHHASRAVTYMSVSIARWYRPGGSMRPETVAAENVAYALSIMNG